MEAMLFVYFANILPQISSTIGGTIVVLAILLALWIVMGSGLCCDWGTLTIDNFNWNLFKKPLYFLAIPLIFLTIVRPFLPDRNTMYLMAGAYVGQQVLTSEVAKDAYEIIGLEVNKILQEKKKELQSKVESTTKEITQ